MTKLLLVVYKSYKLLFLWWFLFILIDIALSNYEVCTRAYSSELLYVYYFFIGLFCVQAILMFVFAYFWREDNAINDRTGLAGMGAKEVQPIVLPLYFTSLILISKITIALRHGLYVFSENTYNFLLVVLLCISSIMWFMLRKKAKIKWEPVGTVVIVLYTVAVIYYKELEPILGAFFNISGCIVTEIKATVL